MNRKFNPYVSLVAFLLLALILVLTCTGCRAEAAAASTTNPKNVIAEATETTEPAEPEKITGSRFTVEFANFGWPYLDGIYIITDNQTGTQYLFCERSSGCGMTKLEG